ncbi:hypothetical protein [Nocardioides sp. MH1]|uniref:hypothetical protein n=1 Tax=Nocardioides sp. MH1 TaxID=3242490 RepID=UPI00351FFD2F
MLDKSGLTETPVVVEWIHGCTRPQSAPLHFGDPAGGRHWSAERIPVEDGDSADYAIAGESLTFSWDIGVTVPLWDADGLLPEDPRWLRRALGVSDGLIIDLDRWGRDMCRIDEGLVPYTESMETRANDLMDRLRRELAGRLTVTYAP